MISGGFTIDQDPRVRAWFRRVMDYYGGLDEVVANGTYKDGVLEVPWPLEADAPLVPKRETTDSH